MSLNFHVHRAFVQQTGGRGPISTNRPSAVIEVPRALVTEKNLERIRGRTLKVVRPVVFAMDDAVGACFEVDGVDHFRCTGGPLGFERASAAARGWCARDRLSFGIGRDADEERFVTVDRILAAADARWRGELRDLSDSFGVEVDCDDGIPATYVGFARAPRGGDYARIGGDDFYLWRG